MGVLELVGKVHSAGLCKLNVDSAWLEVESLGGLGTVICDHAGDFFCSPLIPINMYSIWFCGKLLSLLIIWGTHSLLWRVIVWKLCKDS